MSTADDLRRIALASKKVRAAKKSMLEDGEVLETYVEDGEIPQMPLKPVPKSLLLDVVPQQQQEVNGDHAQVVAGGGASNGNGANVARPATRAAHRAADRITRGATRRGGKRGGKRLRSSDQTTDQTTKAAEAEFRAGKVARGNSDADPTEAAAYVTQGIEAPENGVDGGGGGVKGEEESHGQTVTRGEEGGDKKGAGVVAGVIPPEPPVASDCLPLADAPVTAAIEPPPPTARSTGLPQPPSWMMEAGGVSRGRGASGAGSSGSFYIRFDDPSDKPLATGGYGQTVRGVGGVQRGDGGDTGAGAAGARQLADQARLNEMQLVRTKLEIIEKQMALEKKKTAAAATAASKVKKPPDLTPPPVPRPTAPAATAKSSRVETAKSSRVETADVGGVGGVGGGWATRAGVGPNVKKKTKAEKRQDRIKRQEEAEKNAAGNARSVAFGVGVGGSQGLSSGTTEDKYFLQSLCSEKDVTRQSGSGVTWQRGVAPVGSATGKRPEAMIDEDTRRELKALERSAVRVEERRKNLKRLLKEADEDEREIQRRRSAFHARARLAGGGDAALRLDNGGNAALPPPPPLHLPPPPPPRVVALPPPVNTTADSAGREKMQRHWTAAALPPAAPFRRSRGQR